MAGAFATVAERFALKRSNFVLDPERDFDCFARTDIDVQGLVERLRVDLVTELAPKRMFFGPYGAGKSHTLIFAAKQLERLTPIKTIRMECPNLTKKSRFVDLYREGIMRVLGQDLVLGLFEQLVLEAYRKSRDERTAHLRDLLQDDELVRAAGKLVDEEFERDLFWRWFSGVSLSRSELEPLRVTSDLTAAEPARLAAFLTSIGRLLRRFDRRTLLFVFDEMERLQNLDSDSIGNYLTAFTKLADPLQNDLAIVIGYSADLAEEIHELFGLRGPVGSRIGRAATVEIKVLPEKQIEEFASGVIQFLRDESTFDARFGAAEADAASQSEGLDRRFYPFTKKALQMLRSRLGDALTPRDIELSMTHAAGRAHINDWSAVRSGAIQT
jgi:hypothetical protein